MSVPAWLHHVRPKLLIAGSAALAVIFGTAVPAHADPADQTVSFTTSPPTPAQYGGTYVPHASASSNLAVSISVDSSTAANCTYDGTTVTFIHVGSCKLNANQGGNSSFNPASASQTFTIDPHDLTVPVGAVQSYGTATTIFIWDKDQLVGLQFDDRQGVINGTLSCTTSTPVTATSPVGTYPITGCSGISAVNYTIVYQLGSVTVNPAPLRITASGATFTYGHSVPAITPIYSGFVNGEDSSVLTSQPTCSTTATSTSPVGSYPSSCSGASAANYLIGYGNGVVTITRASLIITASSGSSTYGANPPAVTPSYSGFRNGDNAASAFSTQPTCGTAATSSSGVGTYTTSCSGAVAQNYTIAYQAGSMVVNKASLTVTASSASVSFGGDIPAVTPMYTGFVNGDDQFDLAAQPTCSTTATDTSPPGNYPSTCSGASSANYTIHYVAGTISIVKAVLDVTASSATIPYGSSPPAITPFYDGFLNGDGPSSLTTQPTCSTSVTSATAAGSYTSSCSGGVSSNYTFVYHTGTITVKKAVLTVTAQPATRQMGGANVFTYAFSGFVNGDGPGVVSGQPAFSTSANAASEPGQYPIVISAGTLSAANYSFAFVNGWLTVTKGTPHIVGATISKSAATAAHKMTFSATATNSLSGAPIVGVVLKFTVTQGSTTITCSGTTDSTGTASCSSSDGRLLLLSVPRTYSITFAGNYDYLAGSGTGTITA
jgi:MBG domain (YGX type)